MTIKRLFAVLTAAPLLLGIAPAAEAAPATAPITAPVVRPVTGGNGEIVLRGTTFPLSGVGYTQSEFLVSGEAAYYTPTAELGSDGRWSVTPAGTAPYTTRIVVYRPADPARFNGSVAVEWLNVTPGLDVAPDWIYTHNELIREGFGWIGVSAQAIGVNATRAADPVRYADLSHPGDSFSYDIFTQVSHAIREHGSTVLGGLRPRALLAEGESQSAFRLTTYVNAIQPLTRAYDGFLIHSRGGDSAPLSQAPQPVVPAPQIVHLRPDGAEPVLTVQAETDLFVLESLPARQDDSRRSRLWEVAGSAHVDFYLAGAGPGDNGGGAAGLEQLDAMRHPPADLPGLTCDRPINTGQIHYVLDAAQHALHRWVTAGVAPARAPRLQVTPSGSFAVDANGNVVGGVRTPAVDVPVATLSGLGQTGAEFCFLVGTTTPFGAEKLARLYPTHAHFVARWTVSTISLVAQGFLRPADGLELIVSASRSTAGG